MAQKTWTAASLNAARNRTGTVTVEYVTPSKETLSAVVLGAGTTVGLKLQVTAGNQRPIVDNVLPATSMQQVNVYRSR